MDSVISCGYAQTKALEYIFCGEGVSFLVTLQVIRWWADTSTTMGSWTGGWEECVSTKRVISWQMQALCSGVRCYHCSMYQWLMFVVKRAVVDFFHGPGQSCSGGWLLPRVRVFVTAHVCTQPAQFCHHSKIQPIRWQTGRYHLLFPEHIHQTASHPSATHPSSSLCVMQR